MPIHRQNTLITPRVEYVCATIESVLLKLVFRASRVEGERLSPDLARGDRASIISWASGYD